MSSIIIDIQEAALNLQAGKLVAIPTETVYGLAAMVNKPDAIKQIFTMKNRPSNHPLIVHVGIDWDLSQIVEALPTYAKLLIKTYWPGPLTLVLPVKKNAISPLVTGGQSTVAVRCPAHPVALALLKQLGLPLVAPSANPFGKVSPTTAIHVQESFPQEELLILEGGRCSVGIESTIVDATSEHSYQILRHGLITELDLAETITTNYLHKNQEIRTPGALNTHYQPQKKLYYFTETKSLNDFCRTQSKKVYAIANQKPESVEQNLFHSLGATAEKAAFNLYYLLRQADASEASYIVIELPPDNAAWAGVRERIQKAGESN